MEMTRRLLIGAAMAAPLLPDGASAQAGGERRPLWPGRPPGSTSRPPRFVAEEKVWPDFKETWFTGVAVPTLEIVRPARSNGIGLLVIPGGGYRFVSYTNEGINVARRLAGMGYTAAVLAYRLPAEGWERQADVPLQDAQRAMRLLRAAAPELARVGVIGASAGGHLAATLATAYDERVYDAVDARDKATARPDFAGLLYPVTTLELPSTHLGSREKLLGKAPSPAEVARRSPVRHVDARTPPSFVLHSFDDDVVPVDCALQWIAAARAARVPVEAHLIERGGHGYGVRLPATNPGALWPEQFDRWIGQLPAARS